jgi:(p)ppGpp synthase/HD superfamily hydrolase
MGYERLYTNRTDFFNVLQYRFSHEELAYIQKAYWLVKEAHRKQVRRLTGERYFEHVRRVAYSAAYYYDYYDAEIVTLGLLHDVVEDTFVPSTVLVNLFGARMYEWVLVLSKEIPAFHPVNGRLIARAKLKDEQYFGGLEKADKQPRIIKGCDRLDNLTDIRQWEPERQQKYMTETETYILPLIRNTDVRIAVDIETRMNAPVRVSPGSSVSEFD